MPTRPYSPLCLPLQIEGQLESSPEKSTNSNLLKGNLAPMHSGKLRGVKFAGFATLACILSFSLSCGKAWAAQNPVPNAAPGVETPRIIDHIDENNLAVLKGNTRPEARAEFDR